MWVALGRLPEIEIVEAREPGKFNWIDWRRDPSVGVEGAPDVIHVPYSQAEFGAIGAPVDYERYQWLWDKVGNEQESEIWERHEKLASVFREKRGLSEDRWNEETPRQEAQVEADLARELRDIEAVFEPLIDRAFASVFSALSSGQIACEGWYWDERNPSQEQEFRAVPTSMWTLKNFNLRDCEILVRDFRYSVVQVSAQAALSCFPAPMIEPTRAEGTMVGDTFVVDASTPAQMTARRRGRPEKATATARDVVTRVFAERQKKGSLPEKKEALVQEVIDFVRVAFGVEISRSTAQTYLRGLQK